MQFFRTGLHWDISSVLGTRHTGLTLCPHLGGWEGLGSRDSRAADCCCASRGLATSWPPLAARALSLPQDCAFLPLSPTARRPCLLNPPLKLAGEQQQQANRQETLGLASDNRLHGAVLGTAPDHLCHFKRDSLAQYSCFRTLARGKDVHVLRNSKQRHIRHTCSDHYDC